MSSGNCPITEYDIYNENYIVDSNTSAEGSAFMFWRFNRNIIQSTVHASIVNVRKAESMYIIISL